MSAVVSPGTGGNTAPSGKSEKSRQKTELLPRFFAKIDPSHRLTVLELGPALPETISFFSDYRCTIHCLDLLDEPIVRDPDPDWTLQEWQAQFLKVLQFPRDTRFDLCFFWDILNYLPAHAVTGFSWALRPWLTARSRGHGFAARTADLWLENHLYGIEAADSLRIRPRPGKQPGYEPHTQMQLNRLLNCFEVHRGMLLPDGRLEVLLQAHL